MCFNLLPFFLYLCWYISLFICFLFLFFYLSLFIFLTISLSLPSSTVPYFICFLLNLHLSHLCGSFSPLSASFPLLVICHFVSLSIQFHAAIVSLSLFVFLYHFSLSLSLQPIYFVLPSGIFSALSFQSIKSIWILSSSSLFLSPLLLSSHPVCAFYSFFYPRWSPPLSSPAKNSTIYKATVGPLRPWVFVKKCVRACVCSLRKLLPSLMVNQEWTQGERLTCWEIKQ